MSPILGGIGGVSVRGFGHFPNLYFSSFDSIATTTVGAGGASSVSFSSIPAGYTHLQIRGLSLTNTAVQSVSVRFNSDSGANYSRHNLEGTGTSAVSETSPNDTIVRASYTGSTSNPSVFVMDILDYANTNKNKTIKSLSGIDQNGSGYINLWSGAWYNTAAITQITITANFNQYSSFALYGIKVA